jgi:hypothetical protein
MHAQLPPITAPGGQARFEIGGRFSYWDQAFVAGQKRAAIAEFIRNPVDGTWLPGLSQSEAALRAATGVEGLNLSPGRTTGSLAVNLGALELGAALGITSRITLFGTIPIVRVRVQEQLLIDSTGATAGFNPADARFGTSAGAAATHSFLSYLTSVLTTLNGAIQAGRYDADPGLRAEAQATLARGTSLRAGLETLLLESPFLPIAGSAGARAVTQSIDSLRLRLAALDPDGSGNEPLPGAPALPSAGLAPGALEDYATRSGLIQASSFEPEIYTALGDVEVGAAFALLNSRPPARGFAVRSVLAGTLRLPTARLADPNGLFAVGTGARHFGIRGEWITDVMGSRYGARFQGGLMVQQSAELPRRVTSPEQPLAPASTLAFVERRPGSTLELSFQPYFRIARSFSVVAGIHHWQKQADRYTYAPGQEPIPGVDPGILAQDSKENGTLLSAGFSFSHAGMGQDGEAGLPLDAVVAGQMVVGSSEGRVAAQRSIVFRMRVYGKVF